MFLSVLLKTLILYKADLQIFVDRNQLQIDGSTEDVMQLEPLQQKWEAFGWEVKHCDGNDIQDLINTLSPANTSEKPIVVLAHTTMGKGIVSIEDDHQWHAGVPSANQLPQFLKELKESR